MLRSPHILTLSKIVSAVLSLIETKNSWSYRAQRDKTNDWNWIWEKKSFIWILNILEGIRGDSTINIHVATANACTSFPACARGTTLSFRIKARFVPPRNGSRDIELLLSGMHSKQLWTVANSTTPAKLVMWLKTVLHFLLRMLIDMADLCARKLTKESVGFATAK